MTVFEGNVYSTAPSMRHPPISSNRLRVADFNELNGRASVRFVG
jgi:hypothetical protein